MFPKRVWKVKAPSPRATQLALESDLSLLQAQLMLNRGISHARSARQFMCPRLSDLDDPMLFKDMDRAVSLLLKTLDLGRPITVYGDYDADGLTATALLVNFFRDLGIQANHCIPNRFRDGYGLNVAAVRKLAADGAGLIITVDCGVSNTREIALAQELGIDVIVTDHHQVPPDFKPLCPVIDPHRKDCGFPFKDLSGVGLSFFLAVALRGALRESGRFERGVTEPDLKSYLDLVALGTVADRAPLLGQNRILVHSGMRAMGASRWPGLRALMAVSDVTASRITGDDLAFRLGPRLNAPGRVDDPEICMDVLREREMSSALKMAREIAAANAERQRVELEILVQIDDTLEASGGLGASRSMVVAGKGWSQGVLGIVASRLAEKYYRPALVFTVLDGIAIGSGRSIEGFNLYGALAQLGHLFQKFGGHAHAAGFRMRAENLDPLRRELEAIVRTTVGEAEMIPTVQADAEVSLHEVNFSMLEQISPLAPFGEGNPEPRFLARSLRVVSAKVVGSRHLKLKVSQGDSIVEAIGFGMGDRFPLLDETVDMIFVPEANQWHGCRRIQLRVIDVEKSDRISSRFSEDPGSQFDVLGAEYE